MRERIAAVLLAPVRGMLNEVRPRDGWVLAGVVLLVVPGVLLAGWSIREVGNAAAALAAVAIVMLWLAVAMRILVQNRPLPARLVPGHVRSLRLALVSSWALVVLGAALGPGLALGAPAGWAMGAGVGLALMVALARWQHRAAPIAMGVLLAMSLLARPHGASSGVTAAAAAAWAAAPVLCAALALAACAMLLASTVRRDGQSFDPRNGAAPARAAGKSDQGLSRGRIAGLDAAWSRMAARRHARRLHQLLSHADGDPMARALIGLGVWADWRLAASAVLRLGAAGLGAQTVLLVSPIRAVAWSVLASFALLAMLRASTPALTAAANLRASRREQALVALLPGVPRGGLQARALSRQLTIVFAVSFALACGVLGLAIVQLRMMGPPLRASTNVLPAVAWALAFTGATLAPALWRPWSRSRPQVDTHLPSVLFLVQAGLVVGASSAIHEGWLAPADVAAVCLPAPLAWCAMRWRRMADEPAAFPVGRLAR